MKTIFGPYLRTLRKQRSLRLNKAAYGLKIDATLLSKYEIGTRFPKADTLRRIAQFYGVSRNRLAKMIAKDKEHDHYQRLSSPK